MMMMMMMMMTTMTMSSTTTTMMLSRAEIRNLQTSLHPGEGLNPRHQYCSNHWTKCTSQIHNYSNRAHWNIVMRKSEIKITRFFQTTQVSPLKKYLYRTGNYGKNTEEFFMFS